MVAKTVGRIVIHPWLEDCSFVLDIDTGVIPAGGVQIARLRRSRWTTANAVGESNRGGGGGGVGGGGQRFKPGHHKGQRVDVFSPGREGFKRAHRRAPPAPPKR